MYECILVILTELRTADGAFLVIQCFCKKWGEKTINNRDKDKYLIIIFINKDNNHTMNSTENNIKCTKD